MRHENVVHVLSIAVPQRMQANQNARQCRPFATGCSEQRPYDEANSQRHNEAMFSATIAAVIRDVAYGMPHSDQGKADRQKRTTRTNRHPFTPIQHINGASDRHSGHGVAAAAAPQTGKPATCRGHAVCALKTTCTNAHRELITARPPSTSRHAGHSPQNARHQKQTGNRPRAKKQAQHHERKQESHDTTWQHNSKTATKSMFRSTEGTERRNAGIRRKTADRISSVVFMALSAML